MTAEKTQKSANSDMRAGTLSSITANVQVRQTKSKKTQRSSRQGPAHVKLALMTSPRSPPAKPDIRVVLILRAPAPRDQSQ
jgi:hypothetical protein